MTDQTGDAVRPSLDFADFAGKWRLSRRITDRLSASTGQFNGCARFTPTKDGYLYHEEGILTLPGQAPMQATRRYFWVQDQGRVSVRFEDGRAFHSFALDDPKAEADHFCAPDSYQVQYDFSTWPVWRAAWQVKGPRKDYEMVSEYVENAD